MTVTELCERSKIARKFVDDDLLWQETLQSAYVKEIAIARCTAWSDPLIRISFLEQLIKCNGKMLFSEINRKGEEIKFPHMIKIPKEEPGEYRICKVEPNDGRIIFAFLNNCLFDLNKDMVHHSCRSYQKGMGTQGSVEEVSREICKMPHNKCGAKIDYHAYFDTVLKECVFKIFDIIEERDGQWEQGTNPFINLMRTCYDNDFIYDLDKNLICEWSGIRQGNPISAFLADVVLYDVDEFMSKKYPYYIRYSDDSIILTDSPEEAIADIKRLTEKYGVVLNDKKTEIIYKNRFVKFLGFSILSQNITISRRRLGDFEKQILDLTINLYRTVSCKEIKPGKWQMRDRLTGKSYGKVYTDKKECLETFRKWWYKQSIEKVMNFLYGDPNSDMEFSWSTSILPTINVQSDLIEMNKFVQDCLRAVITGKYKINGLGYEANKIHNGEKRLSVVTYSPASGGGGGKNVKANMEKQKKLPIWLPLMCMQKLIKMSKFLFISANKNARMDLLIY